MPRSPTLIDNSTEDDEGGDEEDEDDVDAEDEFEDVFLITSKSVIWPGARPPTHPNVDTNSSKSAKNTGTSPPTPHAGTDDDEEDDENNAAADDADDVMASSFAAVSTSAIIFSNSDDRPAKLFPD